MGFTAVKCPSCGASVELDSSREFGFCSYCGTKIVQDKIIHEHRGSVKVEGTVTADSLFERGRIMLSDGDFRNAAKYFDRVLDIDPHKASAYWGKMCCEYELRSDEEVRNRRHSIKHSQNYQNALEFSVGKEHEKYVILGNITEENQKEAERLSLKEQIRKEEAHQKEQYLNYKSACNDAVKKAKKSLCFNLIIHVIFLIHAIRISTTYSDVSIFFTGVVLSAVIFCSFSIWSIKVLSAKRKTEVFAIPSRRFNPITLFIAHIVLMLILYIAFSNAFIPDDVIISELISENYVDVSLTEPQQITDSFSY